MEQLLIKGGLPLKGKVTIPCAKNSVLPILAACILADGTSVINNVPKIKDVNTSAQILEHLGFNVSFQGSTFRVSAQKEIFNEIPKALTEEMRSSVFYLAPLLCKTGKVVMAKPGGCKIGDRPIDIHLAGLCEMGASYTYSEDMTLTCTAENGLTGCDFTLRLPSVGATETLIMAASVAKGKTILRNVATEPEVEDLAAFLNKCGAKIKGAGTKTICITGVEKLNSTIYTPMPDRIITSTVLCAVAATKGEAVLKNANAFHVMPLITALRLAGCDFEIYNADSIKIKAEKRLLAVGEIETAPYPGFATDSAPLLAAAMITSNGKTVITDTIFSNRFECANGFNELGAQCTVRGETVEISGIVNLKGTHLKATDLRGGAALVIAALCSEGQSVLTGLEYITRGYENIATLFTSLGADITQI